MSARKGDGQLGELRCDCHDCPCPDGNHAKEEKRPCEAPSEAEIVPRPAFLRERKNTRSLHHHRLERRRIGGVVLGDDGRSEEHTSELQSLMRISYAVFCLKKKIQLTTHE